MRLSSANFSVSFTFDEPVSNRYKESTAGSKLLDSSNFEMVEEEDE